MDRTEQLCKRHLAKLLSILEGYENGLDEVRRRIIMKSFSYLMRDLRLVSNSEENNNDKQQSI